MFSLIFVLNHCFLMVQMGITLLWVSHLLELKKGSFQFKQISRDIILCLYDRSLSYLVLFDTFLGFLVAPVVAMFEVFSKGRPGFFNTLVAKFLPAPAETLPYILKKCRIGLLVLYY